MSVKRWYTMIQVSSFRNFLLSSMALDFILFPCCYVSIVLSVFSCLLCMVKDQDTVKHFSTTLKPGVSLHWRALIQHVLYVLL